MEWPRDAIHPQKVRDAVTRYKRASMARKSAHDDIRKLIYSPLSDSVRAHRLSVDDGNTLAQERAKWLVKNGLARDVAYCLCGIELDISATPCLDRGEADVIFREIDKGK